MKRSLSSLISAFGLLAPALLVFVVCSGGGTISGTGPHKIAGVLYEQCDNKPAVNATVYLRPVDYLPEPAGLSKRAASTTVQTTVTDKNGRFGFDDLSTGNFTIEGISSDEKTVILMNDVEITSNLLQSATWLDINTQGYDTILQPPATIIGTVPVPDDCNGGTVSVFGTDHNAEINSDGTFILENIPQSTLRLQLKYSAGSVSYSDTITATTTSGLVARIDTSTTVFSPQAVIPVTFAETFSGFDYDRGVSIKQTLNGEYIIAGKYGTALHLLTIDTYGTVLVDNQLDSYCQSECHFIEQIQNDGFITAGRTPDQDSEYYNLTVSVTDISGTILWSDTSSGTYIDEVTVIQQTTDGGFILAGNRSEPVSSAGFCLIKINDTGEVIWEHIYSVLTGLPGETVQQTDDGGYICTATSLSNQRFFIGKTDSDGTSLWEKSYGSSVKNSSHSIIETSDNGFIITGSTMSTDNSVQNVYLLKTDADGVQQWEKTFESVNNQVGHEIKQTSDGGYIIIGTSTADNAASDILVLKTDNAGTMVWSKTFGETNRSEDGNSVWLTSDGGFIFAASVASTETSEESLYLIRTDAEGNFQ